MNLLKCENLCKKLSGHQILKSISFSINSKDILAFIGPNGSGKTTTIKLLLGLQSIDSGNVTINGYDLKTDFKNAISKVGSIVENPDSYMYLTGWQNLKLIANLYKDVTDEKIMEIVKLVGLEKRIHESVSKYSLGMRQRLGIAKSLINEPNILILDEPTNGLDPEGIKDLRDLLKKLAKQGMGILISSHNLAELESFCNKVLIIEDGKIIEESAVSEFKKNEDKYLFKVSSTKNLKLKNIYEVENDSFMFNGDLKSVSEMVRTLVNNNIDVYEVRKCELSLEDAFLQKTGGKNDKAN